MVAITMSLSVEVSQLKGIVTCAICLDAMINPKILHCNHSYCKRCLDGLLEFDAFNDTAKIKCPKCSQYTLISSTETTNDLLTDYSARDLVDVISETEGPSSESGTCDLCSGDVVKYCVFCKLFLCANCKDPHDEIPYSFEFLNFNKREMQFSLFCKDHKTDVSSICCGEEVCVYCLKREHKMHNSSQKLDEVEESMKNQLKENMEHNTNIGSRLQDIKEKMINTEKELEVFLDKKIQNCLSDFAKFLNEEADDIRGYFHSHAKHHYQKVQRIDNNEYFNSCLSKTGFNFQLERKEISRKLEYGTISEISIKLTEASFKDQHPLGALEHQFGATRLSPLSNETFKIDFFSGNINSSLMPLDHLEQVPYEEQCLGKGFFSSTIDNVSKVASYVKMTSAILLRGMWFEFSFGRQVKDSTEYANVRVVAKSWGLQHIPVQYRLKCHNSPDLVVVGRTSYLATKKANKNLIVWSDMLDEKNGYLINDSITIEVFMQADLPLVIFSWDSKKLTGYAGLRRHKHRCYINPILQTLFSLLKLRKILITITDETSSVDSDENLIEIWQAVQQSFLKLCGSMDNVSVKGLHSLINCGGKSSFQICQLLYQAIEKMASSDGIISELMEGKILSTLECSQVEHCYRKEDSFNGIELAIEQGDSLEESIANYLRIRALSLLSCAGVEDCVNNNIKKENIFRSLPPILQFHLIGKPKCSVQDHLDLSKFLVEDVVSRPELNYYLLQSVLVYERSRYFVYISPNVDGNWLKFDDMIVSKVSQEEALQKIIRKDVCMLTYIRKSDLHDILEVEPSSIKHLHSRSKKRKLSKTYQIQ